MKKINEKLKSEKIDVNNQNNIKCVQMPYYEYSNNNNSYRSYNNSGDSKNSNETNNSQNNENDGFNSNNNSGSSNNGDNNNNNNNNNNNFNIDFSKDQKTLVRPSTLKNSEEIMEKYFRNHSLKKEFLDQYSLSEELGEGGYGFVISCIRNSDNKKVAVKFIIREKVPVSCWVSNAELGMIPQEIHILKMINHKNIIKFIDYFEDDKYFYLVQELHGTIWANNLNIPLPGIENSTCTSCNSGQSQSQNPNSNPDNNSSNNNNIINHLGNYYDNTNPLPTPPFYDQSIPSKPFYVNPSMLDIQSRKDLDPNNVLKSLTIQEIEEIELREKSAMNSGSTSIPVKGARKLTNVSFSSSFSSSTSSSPIYYYNSNSNYKNVNHDINSPLPPLSPVNNKMEGSNHQDELSRSISPNMSSVNQKSIKSSNKNRNLQKKPSMDLFECIERHPQLEESRVKYIMRQVVECVYYLVNTCSVVHRDIKDENIVIDENYNIKIIDFGSASILPKNCKNRFFTQFNGTLQYASPEIIRGEKYSALSQEVWSMGILMYMLLCEGEHPFGDPNNVVNKPLMIHRQCSPECIDLLYRMLDKNPVNRIKIDDVYNHPWFKN